MLVDVICPEGVREGELLAVQLGSGERFEVVVPTGVCACETFQVELDAQQAVADASEPARTVIDAAEQANRLTQSDAATLRSILQALHDFDALDDFIDKHATQFDGYTVEGEQRLEWTSLHNEYMALVEGRVQEHLQAHGSSTQELIELLGTVVKEESADMFLTKLLSMSNYEHFCTLMCSWADDWFFRRREITSSELPVFHVMETARL